MSESSRFGSADIASTVEQLIRGEMVSSRVLCTSVERGEDEEDDGDEDDESKQGGAGFW